MTTGEDNRPPIGRGTFHRPVGDGVPVRIETWVPERADTEYLASGKAGFGLGQWIVNTL